MRKYVGIILTITTLCILIGFVVHLYYPQQFNAIVRLPNDPNFCKPYLHDPMMEVPIEKLTKETIQAWVESAYKNLEQYSEDEWEDGSLTVWWSASTRQYRADFAENGHELLGIYQFLVEDNQLKGQQVIQCFGEPIYYQAYNMQQSHDIALIVGLFYPERGIALSSFDLINMSGFSQPSDKVTFSDIRRFTPVGNTKEALAPHVMGIYRAWQSDPQGWAELALHEWEGWDTMQILTDEDIEGASRTP